MLPFSYGTIIGSYHPLACRLPLNRQFIKLEHLRELPCNGDLLELATSRKNQQFVQLVKKYVFSELV